MLIPPGEAEDVFIYKYDCGRNSEQGQEAVIE
jgi:hypothetical protein